MIIWNLLGISNLSVFIIMPLVFLQATFDCLLKSYGFLTLEFWKETRFSKSPFQEYTDLLAKPTGKALILEEERVEAWVSSSSFDFIGWLCLKHAFCYLLFYWGTYYITPCFSFFLKFSWMDIYWVSNTGSLKFSCCSNQIMIQRKENVFLHSQWMESWFS